VLAFNVNMDFFQGQWYGGGESLKAAWPLQRGHIKLSPFVTGDEVRPSIISRVKLPQ